MPCLLREQGVPCIRTCTLACYWRSKSTHCSAWHQQANAVERLGIVYIWDVHTCTCRMRHDLCLPTYMNVHVYADDEFGFLQCQSTQVKICEQNKAENVITHWKLQVHVPLKQNNEKKTRNIPLKIPGIYNRYLTLCLHVHVQVCVHNKLTTITPRATNSSRANMYVQTVT